MKVTKAMTRVLRHSAVEQGLAIRVDGFLDVQELLSERRVQALGVTKDEVIEAVHSNDKKRFELLQEGTQVFIRATQGHSMRYVEDEQLLTPLDQADPLLPTVCVHGTYRRHVESILQQGLLAGGGKSQRKHVHFAPFEPGDKEIVSGMRYDCDTAIYLDLRGALRAGLPFFKSSNNVILSPGIGGVVAPEYISQVKHWQHGAWVSESVRAMACPTSSVEVSDTANAFGKSGAVNRDRVSGIAAKVSRPARQQLEWGPGFTEQAGRDAAGARGSRGSAGIAAKVGRPARRQLEWRQKYVAENAAEGAADDAADGDAENVDAIQALDAAASWRHQPATESADEGAVEGAAVGAPEGSADGDAEGRAEGTTAGAADAAASWRQQPVTESAAEGAVEGASAEGEAKGESAQEGESA